VAENLIMHTSTKYRSIVFIHKNATALIYGATESR